MTAAFSIGLSGLQAAATRLAVSAGNVVNAGSRPVAPVQRSSPGRSVGRDAGFQAMRVYQEALATGGVRATPAPVRPAAVPGNLFAPAGEGEGLRPNVSLGREAVEQMSARRAYQAGAKVLKTADDMTDRVLDIVT